MYPWATSRSERTPKEDVHGTPGSSVSAWLPFRAARTESAEPGFQAGDIGGDHGRWCFSSAIASRRRCPSVFVGLAHARRLLRCVLKDAPSGQDGRSISALQGRPDGVRRARLSSRGMVDIHCSSPQHQTGIVGGGYGPSVFVGSSPRPAPSVARLKRRFVEESGIRAGNRSTAATRCALHLPPPSNRGRVGGSRWHRYWTPRCSRRG